MRLFHFILDLYDEYKCPFPPLNLEVTSRSRIFLLHTAAHRKKREGSALSRYWTRERLLDEERVRSWSRFWSYSSLLSLDNFYWFFRIHFPSLFRKDRIYTWRKKDIVWSISLNLWAKRRSSLLTSFIKKGITTPFRKLPHFGGRMVGGLVELDRRAHYQSWA